MKRSYPALALTWLAPPADAAVEQVLALVDDDRPTAVDGDGLERRVFFASADDRDRACRRLARAAPDIRRRAIDVPDENWAERSQAALRPVEVGRFVVAPPWHAADVARESTATTIVIQPSMGFGTGHHASTRLCLHLLQAVPVENRSVLDVGTGSGILALAAWRLGARGVEGLDPDPDALDSAFHNLALNGATGAVRLRRADLTEAAAAADRYDLLLANLTAGRLCRDAARLAALARPGAHLIASGFEIDERDAVVKALADHGWMIVSHADEGGWCGALFGRNATSPTGSRAR